MRTITKRPGILTILGLVILITGDASLAGEIKASQGPNHSRHMTIKINGISSDTFLVDDSTGTNGFLNVGRDQIANTTSLDFAYTTPDPADPTLVFFIQGMGEIPNSGFTVGATSARLLAVTPFPVTHCVVNLVTAYYDCQDGEPIAFDLTWAKSGLGSIHEKVSRRETIGPLTIKYKAEYDSLSAIVSGTWTGHSGSGLSGNLVDSKNVTNTREITIDPNP